MRKKDKNKIKTGLNLNLILLILIPTLLIGLTVAKYIKEEQLEVAYQAKNFYFQSDLLTESVEVPEYTYSEGIDTISFYLKNNDDSLRYSEVDISYTATITKDGEICDTKEGTILKDAVNLERVEFTNLEAGEYIVTAKATSPYEKTLSGKFTISPKNENIEYEVIDTANNPVIKLTITTKDYAGDIVIAYPEGVVPDNTNEKLTEVTTSNVTTTFEENSSYTFTFLKTNPVNVYAKTDFTVTKEN